ncbi:hypothetical protein PV08_06670 [Exophiala spinifera]|uniref:AB hydrolase-1 domain-containing protein n=1 Tax=Exophiala spinifera TaxID=91928 RepID=A0A0D2BRM0_9EURO|nr:uncharacterized protein PV08_06670 [Exophiala spinifera]KIW13889.1 hypothetical protein PV08_06670 [Exophiala spinifera]
MRSSVLLAALATAAPILANPVVKRDATTNGGTGSTFRDDPQGYMSGFRDPRITTSAGNKAICIEGMIDVAASASNYKINLEEPTRKSDVVELVVEAFQTNSTAKQQYVGAATPISGTYGIYSQLCFPRSTDSINSTTVQFLNHGAGFDRSYWNVAPGYSYVDFAAAQGYTTFLFDRLGTGLSDHPDPLQVVQYGIQVEIAHQLIRKLRAGAISKHAFTSVVAVGHSFGSIQLTGITSTYPHDVDALVLTGFTADPSGMPFAFAGWSLTPASISDPVLFGNLSGGYTTSASIEADQFFFFRAPSFDQAVLNLARRARQTLAVGELLGIPALGVSSSFTGPVDFVIGANDLPNCFGNCVLPYDKVAAAKEKLYPAASNGSDSYLAPDTGHGLNFHYTAEKAYEHIHDFIRKNGF